MTNKSIWNCSVDILSISDKQVSQSDMQADGLLGFGKLSCIFENYCEIWQEANVIVLE